MFIETHVDKDKILTFVRSANVQAYPCGRRRSSLVDQDNNVNTQNDQYYFPFDPEARLNTEANNRKHSGLNGFTQTYLKDWNENFLTISLAGYLFTITLDEGYSSENAFGLGLIDQIAKKLGTDNGLTNDRLGELKGGAAAKTDAERTFVSAYNELLGEDSIYANILIEDVHLFSGFKNYYTGVLRNQSASESEIPETSLDLLVTGTDLNKSNNSNNYYFSGVSFSTEPLTGDVSKPSVDIKIERDTKTFRQTIVSLCILKKSQEAEEDEATWKLYQPALLPKIEHGETENSVKVNDITTEDITAEAITADSVDTESVAATDIQTDTITVDDTLTTKDISASGTITATNTLAEDANNIEANKASIVKLVADTVGADTSMSAPEITATSTLYQNNGDKTMKVPIIELIQDVDYFQLKISRIGEKASN